MARVPHLGYVSTIMLLSACDKGKDVGDAMDTGGAESLAPELAESPVVGAVARPASVLVRVLGPDGEPLTGAAVVLDGRGLKTNEQGDVAFFQLRPGELSLRVVAPGMVPISRPVYVAAGGLVRLSVSVNSAAPAVVFDGSVGVTSSVDGATLSVPRGAVLTLDGEPFAGDVDLSWRARVTDEASPADDGLVGVDLGRDRVALHPIGGLSLSLSGADQTTLQVDPAHPVVYRQLFDVTLDEDECMCLSAWRKDDWTGTWVEDPDATLTPVLMDELSYVEASLPSAGEWLFAAPQSPTCLDVTIVDCEGGDGLPLSVQSTWQGGDEIRARTAVDPVVRFDDIRPGAVVELSLIGVDVPLDTEVITAEAGDTCASVTLTVPDCAGLAVEVQTEAACPSDEGVLQVVSADGAETYEADLAGLVQLPDLTAGDWTINVLDLTGALLWSEAVHIEDGALTLVSAQVDGLEPLVPPGGCAEAPCVGGDCSACLDLTVTGADGQPLAGEPVSAYEPVDEVVATDLDGQVCLEGDPAVGVALLTAVAGVEPVAVPLTHTGTCGDTSTCAELTLATSDGCAADETAWSLRAQVLDWYDPGQIGGPLDADAWALHDTTLTISGLSGVGAVKCVGSVWSALGLEVDPLGVLAPADTWVGCAAQGGLQVMLEIGWPQRPLGVEALAVEDPAVSGKDAVHLRLQLQDLGGNVVGDWTGRAGALEVLARGPGRLISRGDLTLVGEGGLSSEVELTLDAALVSAAQSLRDAARVAEYDALGRVIHVAAPGLDWERSFISSAGTLGVPPPPDPGGTEADPPGGSVVCVPQGVPVTLDGGGGLDDLLRPFAPMTQGRPGQMKLYKNTSPGATALIPETLRWTSRDLAETLYRNNHRPVSEIDTSATLLGRPARWDSSRGALVALHGFSSAVLRGPDGSVYRAVPLDGSLMPTTAGAAEYFVFLGVPPASWDSPYVLTLKDAGGVVVSEYTQRFAPIARGVAVIAWDAEEG